MPNLYLGRWEWITDSAGDSYWRPPGGDNVGAFDLRNRSQMAQAGGVPGGFGLFVYSGTRAYAELTHNFGSDLTRNLTALEKSAIRTFFNIPLGTPVVDRLGAALRQWLLDPDYYDATGLNHWKPLLGSLGRSVEFTLGGFGTISREVFTSSHPAFQAKIAVFKADYIRNREVAMLDPRIMRKWTGATLLALTGKLSDIDADALLPAKYRSDGFEPPTTTISDTFTDTNGTSLDAHTSDSGGTWAEITGNWSIASNQATHDSASGFGALARHTTALSSDDQNSKITIANYGGSTGNGRGGACARMSTDASPNHDLYRAYTIAGVLNFAKFIDGTMTDLDSDKTITQSAPDDVECECSNSTMISRFNGVVAHNFSDSSITGNLYCGISGLRTPNNLLDNFVAQDLVAAGGRIFKLAGRGGGLAGSAIGLAG